MLERFTYKQRNMGLVVITIFMCFIIYQRSIKKTLLLVDDCHKMEQQITSAKASSGMIGQLQREIKHYDQLIGDAEKSSNEIQQDLMDSISNYCKRNNMIITEIPEAHSYSENSYMSITNQVNIEGDFVNLLKLTYNLEQQFSGAKPLSVKYYSRKNTRTKKTKLYATIYFQNIKKI